MYARAAAPSRHRKRASRLACSPPPLHPTHAPHRCPCLRPSARGASLQPTPQLEHLRCQGHDCHVCRVLLPAPCAPHCSHALVHSLPYTHAVHAHRGQSPPPTSRGPPLTPYHMHVPLCACDPRQGTHKFNQPLSWDTSGVTDMDNMFRVRCYLHPVPRNLYSRALSSVHAACTAQRSAASLPPPPSPPAARRAGPHRVYSPACDPRQNAQAFNQPLSWNTSGVTDMHAMFYVRFPLPRSLPTTICILALSPACCVHTMRSAATPAAHVLTPRTTCAPAFATFGREQTSSTSPSAGTPLGSRA